MADVVRGGLRFAGRRRILGPVSARAAAAGSLGPVGSLPRACRRCSCGTSEPATRRSLATCASAADLMARIYLDGNRRVLDAGAQEMNMAVIHSLGMLYRQTGEPRYRQLMAQHRRRLDLQRRLPAHGPSRRRILSHAAAALGKPARSARSGRAVSHHRRGALSRRLPAPLVEHPPAGTAAISGAFSSGEQATGNPYEPTPIETCCTIAWMAMSLDALPCRAIRKWPTSWSCLPITRSAARSIPRAAGGPIARRWTARARPRPMRSCFRTALWHARAQLLQRERSARTGHASASGPSCGLPAAWRSTTTVPARRACGWQMAATSRCRRKPTTRNLVGSP